MSLSPPAFPCAYGLWTVFGDGLIAVLFKPALAMFMNGEEGLNLTVSVPPVPTWSAGISANKRISPARFKLVVPEEGPGSTGEIMGAP